MDTQALKLEVMRLVNSTGEAPLLAELKRHLDALHIREAIADSSAHLLKEPEPVPALRAEVKRLVDAVSDTHVLSDLLAFLRGEQDELRWRSVLSARASRSEADFIAGRVFTQEQVEAHFKARRTQ